MKHENNETVHLTIQLRIPNNGQCTHLTEQNIKKSFCIVGLAF